MLRDAENEFKILDDFEEFKNCPHILCVEVMKKKMLEKWIKEYKEPKVAEAWSKSWGSKSLTRVELNVAHPLYGGLPCDNNIVESGNREDKSMLGGKRNTVVFFLGRFSKVLRCQSISDAKFVGDMKSYVRSYKFYSSVQHILNKDTEKRPCLLNVNSKFVNETLGLTKGTILAITDRMLHYIKENYYEEVGDIDHLGKVKAFLKKKKWTDLYKVIMHNEAEMEANSFDSLVREFKCWRTMRPIVVEDSKGEVDEAVLRSVTVLHYMLESARLEMMPLEDICKLNSNNCWMACDCKTYLHYAFCKHCCAMAMKRKIIINFPPTLDPKRIAKSSAGRPKKRSRKDMYAKPDQDQ